MIYTVKSTWDDEAKVWTAESEDLLGLVLESGSLDALMERVSIAALELIELNDLPKDSSIRYISEKIQRLSA